MVEQATMARTSERAGDAVKVSTIARNDTRVTEMLTMARTAHAVPIEHVRVALPVIAPRNDLERMGVSGLRETMLGRANEACCGDCRFLREVAGAGTHPCALGHGRKDLFSRFALICPDFRLTPGIDDEMEKRSGRDRRQQSLPVVAERRSGHDRRVENTYCSDLVLPQAAGSR